MMIDEKKVNKTEVQSKQKVQLVKCSKDVSLSLNLQEKYNTTQPKCKQKYYISIQNSTLVM